MKTITGRVPCGALEGRVGQLSRCREPLREINGGGAPQQIWTKLVSVFGRYDPSDVLDIRMAQDRGYIIADARGIQLGWDVAGTPGQRDPQAQVARDKDGRIIVPPGEPRKPREEK